MFFDDFVDNEIRNDGGITLGTLIKMLSSMPKTYTLKIDGKEWYGEAYPEDLCSYRGYYRLLCIEPGKTPIKVKAFLNKLANVLDMPLTGYKGGEFIMHSEVFIFVAEYGTTSNIVVSGVRKDKESKTVIIETAKTTA